MKMLFLLGIGFDRHGPSVHLLKTIIEEALIAGHEVVMIVRNTQGEAADVPIELQKYPKLRCEVIYDKQQKKSALAKRYFQDIAYFFRCKSILKEHKNTDVVFLQSCTAPIFPIAIIHSIMNKPVLFNVQNIFPNDALVLGKLSNNGIKGLAYRIFRKMQQMAYRKADRIVTISEDMKNTLLGEKVPQSKIDVIHNWSYSDEPINIVNEENLFIRNHPEVNDKFRIVFAGNLGAMVNAELIADVAEKLKHKKDILFVIIGDGNNMPKLKALAEEKSLHNMVFYPYQPGNYAQHNYAMAHININALPKGIIYTCMPSKTATMLNSARPMVVSVEKESCYAKLLNQVERCEVVDVNDVQGFTDAILKLYDSGCTENSSNAREIFRTHCSCTNAKQYIRILENMNMNGSFKKEK